MATYALTGQPQLAAIEYPGPVKDASIAKALASVGGVHAVARALAKHQHPGSQHHQPGTDETAAASKDAQATTRSELELSLDSRDAFHHPVPANVARSANVVLKLTKRKRKRPLTDDLGTVTESGVYTVHVAGIVTHTVRFRAMADFQYKAPLADPMTRLALDLKKLDAKALQGFTWPEPSEEYDETAYLPPPRFSNDAVPKIYEQAAGVGIVESSSNSTTGSEDALMRLANLTRRGTSRIKSITFDSAPQDLPMPVDEDDKEAMRKAFDKEEYSFQERKLIDLLQDRPVWTRLGLLNQLSEADNRQLRGDKTAINNVTYTFSDGPWATLLIRPGYDPRTDPNARFYQNVAFRNIANVRQKATSAADLASKQQIVTSGKTELAHTFDGRTAHSAVGNFQLCDISDPLAESLIQDSTGVLEAPTKDDGWWHGAFLEQIRQIVRIKFYGAVKGHVVSDFDCQHLLGDPRILMGEAAAKPVKVGGGGRRSKKGKGKARDERFDGYDEEEEEAAGHEMDWEALDDSDSNAEDDTAEDTTMENTRTSVGPSATTTLRRKSVLPRVAMPWEKRKTRDMRSAKKQTETEEERALKLRNVLRKRGQAPMEDQSNRLHEQSEEASRSHSSSSGED
ncbi:tau 95 subunit of transcription factor TFIIIC [Microbotryomycetes sp. JL201]|nr:tau 95 subunit of transcription factor TFIIIC [Microbotryomycetes sp. JL201]